MKLTNSVLRESSCKQKFPNCEGCPIAKVEETQQACVLMNLTLQNLHDMLGLIVEKPDPTIFLDAGVPITKLIEPLLSGLKLFNKITDTGASVIAVLWMLNGNSKEDLSDALLNTMTNSINIEEIEDILKQNNISHGE